MRALIAVMVLLSSSVAFAQPVPQVPPPSDPAPAELSFIEPGTMISIDPYARPPVGSCIGGNCGTTVLPPELRLAQAQDYGLSDRARDTRTRFAYTGAILGTVSAALLLGGAITIAQLDDERSEHYTRGVWLGYLAVSTPLVALSAHLARTGGVTSSASKGIRRTGWTAYGLAMTDGIVLWAASFQHDFGNLDILTIGAGAISVFALLPHALDAMVAARGRRVHKFSSQLEPTPNGLRYRF